MGLPQGGGVLQGRQDALTLSLGAVTTPINTAHRCPCPYMPLHALTCPYLPESRGHGGESTGRMNETKRQAEA